MKKRHISVVFRLRNGNWLLLEVKLRLSVCEVPFAKGIMDDLIKDYAAWHRPINIYRPQRHD